MKILINYLQNCNYLSNECITAEVYKIIKANSAVVHTYCFTGYLCVMQLPCVNVFYMLQFLVYLILFSLSFSCLMCITWCRSLD